jgi:hypothetical protein
MAVKEIKNEATFEQMNAYGTDDEINNFIFNLPDDSSHSSSSGSNLEKHYAPSKLITSNVKSSQHQLQQPLRLKHHMHQHHHNLHRTVSHCLPLPSTLVDFPLRSKILRTISSSNATNPAVSLSSTVNTANSELSSGTSSNHSLVNKSSLSSICSSSHTNLICPSLSSPSEYCDSSSSGNEATDYVLVTDRQINKRQSTNGAADLDSSTSRFSSNANASVQLNASNTNIIDLTPVDLAKRWVSYSHLGLSSNNNNVSNKNNTKASCCTCNRNNSISHHSRHIKVNSNNNNSNSSRTNRSLMFNSNLKSAASNSMLFSNLNRTIFNRNFIKRQQKQAVKSLVATSVATMTIRKESNNKDDLDSGCLLRIKTNKLGSSTPNLAFSICSMVRFSI